MEIGPGRELAHYRLVEKLGEGGMGLVWKALDTKLDREVAIKILPDQFTSDHERVQRFGREAKVLASLNQPNIAAIYDFEQEDGVTFLVMELVPGEDLARRLSRGPIPVDAALRIGSQVARALEAAHEHGVIHRDLKPANVHLTEDGTVKVLDFGLAKTFVGGAISGDSAMSPTITSTGTATGVILGTAAYMSPEQARGKPLDKRTDIWSFGCLLFECLCGRSAFGGETISDSLAAILRGEPDWSGLPAGVPARVRELLERCLVKDPRERLRDIGDARFEIDRALASRGTSIERETPMKPARTQTGRLAWGFGLAILGAVLGIVLWNAFLGPARDTAGSSSVARLSLHVGENRVLMSSTLSPDGSSVLYAARIETPQEGEDDVGVFIRRLDSFEAVQIEDVHNFQYPGGGFSPDGKWLALLGTEAADSAQYKLFKVPVDGSAPPLAVADWAPDWESFFWPTPERLIVVTQSPQKIVSIAADGSGTETPVEIQPVGFEGNIRWINTLPDGRHLLATAVSFSDRGWLPQVVLLDSESGEARLLIEDGASPQWSPTGHLVFSRHDTLLVAAFDLDRLEVTSAPVPITRGLRVDNTYMGADFDLSDNGTLLYSPGGVMGAKRRLAIVAEDGSIEDWSPDRRPLNAGPVVSRNGEQVAVTVIGETGLDDIWVADAETRVLRRLVSEPGRDCFPSLFSPVEESLVYLCRSTDESAVYVRRTDGSGEPRKLLESGPGESRHAQGFWPDGSKLLYWVGSGAGESELRLLTLDATAADKPTDTLLLQQDVYNAGLSSDGKWLSYLSNASGRRELYIRRINSSGELGREIPVTTGGTNVYSWSPRSDEPAATLHYEDPDRRVFSVTVTEGRVSRPTSLPWVERALRDAVGGAMLPDGRGLVILKGEEEKPSRELHVVLNWTEELRRRLADSER